MSQRLTTITNLSARKVQSKNDLTLLASCLSEGRLGDKDYSSVEGGKFAEKCCTGSSKGYI